MVFKPISAGSMIPFNFEYCRFSRRIRNGLRPWIRELGGADWWKKQRVKNLVQLFLEGLYSTVLSIFTLETLTRVHSFQSVEHWKKTLPSLNRRKHHFHHQCWRAAEFYAAHQDTVLIEVARATQSGTRPRFLCIQLKSRHQFQKMFVLSLHNESTHMILFPETHVKQ
jgi:hypothetical protein